MRPATIIATGVVVMLLILALMLYPRVSYLISPTSPQGQVPGGLPYLVGLLPSAAPMLL
ncbi:MAG: hypothetical protein ABWK05_04445 [Pyrobaculum sp.]